MKRLLILFLMAIGLRQIVFTTATTLAHDDCSKYWEERSGSWRVVYQAYNQRLVLINKNREVVKVVEEGLVTPSFATLSYSSNCRYLSGSLATTGKRSNTVIWDLESSPVKRVAVFEDSYRGPYRIDWSPDSNYAVVSGDQWADLLRLSDGNRTRLTNKIISDCSIQYAGCGGFLYAFNGLFWHPELKQLHVTLTDGNVAVIDLNNGQPIDFRNARFESLPADEATLLRQQMASPYGCSPLVQYQTYNQRLVLKAVATGELVNIVQDHLALKRFGFLGWSPNCNYIAALIDDGSGLEAVIWDTRTDTKAAVLPYPKDTTYYDVDWSTWAH